MMKKLEEEDHIVLMCKRSMEDIFAIIQKRRGRQTGLHTKEEVERHLNELDKDRGGMTVEGKGITV